MHRKPHRTATNGTFRRAESPQKSPHRAVRLVGQTLKVHTGVRITASPCSAHMRIYDEPLVLGRTRMRSGGGFVAQGRNRSAAKAERASAPDRGWTVEDFKRQV